MKFGNGRSTLILRDERGKHPIQVGYCALPTETTELRGHDNEPVAASGAWTADSELQMQVEPMYPGAPRR